MKTVRVYYAGIPARNNKPEKRQVLENFYKGCPPAYSTEVEGFDYKPSDLAVIQGWVHENSKAAAHLGFRKKIIEQQRLHGKHTLAIDSNLFLYADPENTKTYLRFSLDGIFPTTGNYFTDRVDPSRWQCMSKNLGIKLQPWQTEGKHILICLQRNGGWSMGGLDVMDWLLPTIKKIRKHTDRPIVVRAHPGDRNSKNYLKLNIPNVRISSNPAIQLDFKNCWAAITYNSSPGVAAAIEGIPVFVLDPNPLNSQASDVANTKLKSLENPKMPDRQQWIEKLCMSHFSFDELRNGVAWNIIKDYI